MSFDDEDWWPYVWIVLAVYFISIFASCLVLGLAAMAVTVGAPFWLQVGGCLGALWLLVLVVVAHKKNWA